MKRKIYDENFAESNIIRIFAAAFFEIAEISYHIQRTEGHQVLHFCCE